MIDIIKAIILGIIQGVTEWLPISSTGHLILADGILNLQMTEAFMKMFNVVIQLGSIIAVCILYFNTLNPFDPKKDQDEKSDTWMLWVKIAIASIPAAIAGALLDKFMDKFETWYVIAATLIIYGILFIVIEKRNKTRKTKFDSIDSLDFKTVLLIGCFQMLALIPGTSRSGATIMGALILGLSRTVATEFSFFMAIPVMFGASFLRLIKYFVETGFGMTGLEFGVLFAGSITAFIVSLFVIQYLLKYLKRNDFTFFGYYRIILGVVVIIASVIPMLLA